MLILYFNFILYFSTAIYFYKKKKNILCALIMFLYSIFALSGIYVIKTGIFFDVFGQEDILKLSFLPFLLNFVFVIIIISTIKDYKKYINNEQITNLNYNKKLHHYTEIIGLFWILISFVLSYFLYQQRRGLELYEIYISHFTGEQEEIAFESEWLNWIVKHFFGTLRLVLVPFLYLLFFINITKKKNIKKNFFLVLLLFISEIFYSYNGASRGAIIFSLAEILFYIIIFWTYISSHLRKLIVYSGVILIFAISNILFAISLSRSRENQDNAINFLILRYFGEPFPNLGLRVWQQSNRYTWGERQFPTFFYFITGKVRPEFESGGNMRLHFEQITKFPINNFKTFYGDLYCEWGPLLPFIVALIISIIKKGFSKKLNNSIYMIVIIYHLYHLLIFGIFDNYITQRWFKIIFLSFILLFYLQKKESVYLLSNKKMLSINREK